MNPFRSAEHAAALPSTGTEARYLFQLLEGADTSSIHAACAHLGEVRGGSVEVDVRLVSDEDLLRTFTQALGSLRGVRFHCRGDQGMLLHRLGVRALECHISAAQWRQLQEEEDEGRTRLDGLSIYLAPGQAVPAIDINLSKVRFAFAPPAESSQLADYRQLVPGLMEELRALAARWIQVSFRGALPFCLFTDAQQGELARECLPNEDYRSRPLVLAWRSDGTVVPWEGRLRHLVRALEPGTDPTALVPFYKARKLAIGAPEAFPECAGCALRQRGVCSAWDDLAPPVPSRTTPGVWHAGALRRPDLHARPHPAAAVVADGTDAWLLAIPSDRTLDALRLNEGARKLWDLVGTGGPTRELVERVETLWGEAAAGSVLDFIERLQRSGFLIIEERSERSP